MESFTLVDKINMGKLERRSKKAKMRRKKIMKRVLKKKRRKKMKKIKKARGVYLWHQN